MRPEITALIFFAGCLCWGFCFGAWWTEHEHRKKKEVGQKGRIAISMPAKAEDAKIMLGLLRDFMEQAEKEGLLKK